MTDQDNQTQFTFEEPLFEAPPSLPKEPDAPLKAWYKRPQTLIILGVSTLGLLLFALYVASRPQQQSGNEILNLQASPSPTALSPLEQRVNQLKTELQAADPSKQELPFPPVDMELELASPKSTKN